LRGPSRICPLLLLLSPPTAPHRWLPRRLKPPLHPPLLSKPNQLRRKRNSLPAFHVVLSQPQIFLFSSKGNGMVTPTRMPNATLTHPKLLSSLPLVTLSQRKPSSTRTDTPPFHFFILVPLPVIQSPMPRSPKNKPGHRLPGRAEKERKRLV